MAHGRPAPGQDGGPAPGPDDGGPAPGPDDGGLVAPAGTEGELPGAAPVTATVPPPSSPGEQPDATAYGDLPSAAPVVGAVRKLPEPRLARVTRYRAAAVMIDGVQVDDLHVSAASIIGASHVAAAASARMPITSSRPRTGISSSPSRTDSDRDRCRSSALRCSARAWYRRPLTCMSTCRPRPASSSGAPSMRPRPPGGFTRSRWPTSPS